MNMVERDINVLESVFRYRYLSAEQITVLFFPNTKKANSRLKQLTDSGYLARFEKSKIGGCKPEYVYYLTIMGARIVADYIKKPLTELNWRNTHHKRTSVDHFLNINTFRINMEKACFENNEYIFDFITEYHPLKGNGTRLIKPIKDSVVDIKTNRTLSLIPDGIFYIQKGNKKILFMLEIDNGPMGHNILREKWLAYSIFFDTGKYKERYDDEFEFDFTGFRVLVVTSNTTRLENIIQGAIKTKALDFIWGAVLSKITPESIFTPIWRVAKKEDNNLYSIVNKKDILERK